MQTIHFLCLGAVINQNDDKMPQINEGSDSRGQSTIVSSVSCTI